MKIDDYIKLPVCFIKQTGDPNVLRLAKCRDCGKKGKRLSNKRLCEHCFLARMRVASLEMKNKKGYAWEKYKEKMKKVLNI